MALPCRGDPLTLYDEPRRRTFRDTRLEVLEHLISGGALMLSRQPLETEPELWTDPITGKAFTIAAVHWAQRRGLVRQCADGLFGDGQTFKPDQGAAAKAREELLSQEGEAAT